MAGKEIAFARVVFGLLEQSADWMLTAHWLTVKVMVTEFEGWASCQTKRLPLVDLTLLAWADR